MSEEMCQNTGSTLYTVGRFFVSNLFNYFDPPNAENLLPVILQPPIIWILLLDGVEIKLKFSFKFYEMNITYLK